MQFAYPEMFWLFFVPFILLFGFIHSLKRRKKRLLSFASPENATRLSESYSIDKKVFHFLFLFTGLIFMIVAAAGPQWGKELQQVSRSGIDIIIALDVSKSMLAQDIQPNRLAKAKHEVETFLDRLKGDRVGLIFFAGQSFIQCPLTLDYGAVKMMLELADPNSNPFPGTDIAGAIEDAVKAFEISGKKSRVLVLMTDGETHTPNTNEAFKTAVEKGIVIYTVGFGSGTGVPIPLKDEQGNIIGYKRDDEGNPVLSSMNRQLLTEIAEAAGGEYFAASAEESELDKIAERVDEMEKAKFMSKRGTKYKDRYQYPLTAAFFFLLGYILLQDRKRGY